MGRGEKEKEKDWVRGSKGMGLLGTRGGKRRRGGRMIEGGG